VVFVGAGGPFGCFIGADFGDAAGGLVGLLFSKKILKISFSIWGLIVGLLAAMAEVVLCLFLTDLFGNLMLLTIPGIIAISFVGITRMMSPKQRTEATK